MSLFNRSSMNNRPNGSQPVNHNQISPDTAQIIRAIQQGQRSQIVPMPHPRPSRPKR